MKEKRNTILKLKKCVCYFSSTRKESLSRQRVKTIMKKKRKRVLQTKVLELPNRLKIKTKETKEKKKYIKYNLAQNYLILKRKENNWVL